MKRILIVAASIAFIAITFIGINFAASSKPEQVKPVFINGKLDTSLFAAGLSVPLSGTTNSSGVYSVTFTNPFTTPPNIQANVTGGNANQPVVITKTVSGFTVTVTQRSAATLLTVEVLLAATTPVNNAKVDVLITANE